MLLSLWRWLKRVLFGRLLGLGEVYRGAEIARATEMLADMFEDLGVSSKAQWEAIPYYARRLLLVDLARQMQKSYNVFVRQYANYYYALLVELAKNWMW